MKQHDNDTNRLLEDASNGDKAAFDALWDRLRPEIERRARQLMRREHRRITLETHALVNEVYMECCRDTPSAVSRLHFLRIIAKMMWGFLIDQSRKRSRYKHGGGVIFVRLSSVDPILPSSPAIDIMDLDRCLSKLKLEHHGQRAHDVVSGRFIAGLTQGEIAEVLNISAKTAAKDWRFAQAWLAKCLQNDSTEGQDGDETTSA